MKPKGFININVLLDVITEDAQWAAWSANAIEAALDAPLLAIDAIVFWRHGLRHSGQ